MTREELSNMLPHVLYSFAQSSVVLFFDESASEAIKDGLAAVGWDLQSIENACIESSLIHLRKLNEFFAAPAEDSGRRPDDLRASEFPGFSTPGRFLTKEQSAKISKNLAHFTRIENTASWHFRPYFSCLFPSMIGFLKYLQTAFLAPEDPVRRTVCSLLDDCERFSKDHKLDEYSRFPARHAAP